MQNLTSSSEKGTTSRLAEIVLHHCPQSVVWSELQPACFILNHSSKMKCGRKEGQIVGEQFGPVHEIPQFSFLPEILNKICTYARTDNNKGEQKKAE